MKFKHLMSGLGTVLTVLGVVAGFGLLIVGFALQEPPQTPAADAPRPARTPSGSQSPDASSWPQVARLDIPFDCTGRGPAFRAPPSSAFLATAREDQVSIRKLDGTRVASFRGQAPVAWSPGGLLASGDQGKLWLARGSRYERGEQQVRLLREPGVWGWSPVDDCAATLVDGRLDLVAVGIPPASVTIFEDRVESFSFSPDGRYLAVVRGPRRRHTLWVADLVRDRTREIRAFPRATCCISLGGWSPRGRHLLYWAGTGSSVMADGWPLRSIAPRSPGGWMSAPWGGGKLPATLPRADLLARCDGRLLGLVGGDRFQRRNRIAQIERGGRSLTARSDFSDLTCSTDGRFIAAIRAGRTELLRSDGSLVTRLSEPTAGGGSDVTVEWGPSRTGLLIVKEADAGLAAWFVPEGEREHLVTLFGPPPEDHSLKSTYDWSATPPDGLPAG